MTTSHSCVGRLLPNRRGSLKSGVKYASIDRTTWGRAFSLAGRHCSTTSRAMVRQFIDKLVVELATANYDCCALPVLTCG
ncbi:hypothetical protein PC112_g6753 [Phytophthora cactorum]|nr:hypothetical protein PC112_g6753 [Phytophthora cactorum]